MYGKFLIKPTTETAMRLPECVIKQLEPALIENIQGSVYTMIRSGKDKIRCTARHLKYVDCPPFALYLHTFSLKAAVTMNGSGSETEKAHVQRLTSTCTFVGRTTLKSIQHKVASRMYGNDSHAFQEEIKFKII